MKAPLPTDIFIVVKKSLFFANEDSYVLDYYAPIIGLKAASVYFALKNLPSSSPKTHAEFFSFHQLSEGEFVGALEALEAIGLVKTLMKKEKDSSSFCYAIYSPRDPRDFFSNELLAGTLARYVSKEEIAAITSKYNLENEPAGYEDVSCDFLEYFQSDLTNGGYLTSIRETGGRKTASLSLYFDKRMFLENISHELPSFSSSTLSPSELMKITRLSALYLYDEETMASFVSRSLSLANEYGKRLNTSRLSELCLENDKKEYLHRQKGRSSNLHGDDGVSQLVRAMDRLGSIEFLSKLQNGGKPARADVRLADKLMVEMGLSQNVINAIFFYVLKIKGNVLNPHYVEKLAASVAREGVDTALDTLNFLGGNGKKKTQSPKNQREKEQDIAIKKDEKETSEKQEVADEDYESLLESYGKE